MFSNKVHVKIPYVRLLTMDNTLGNALTVKVSKFINQVKVLKKNWSVSSNSEGGSIISYGGSNGCGQSIVSHSSFSNSRVGRKIVNVQRYICKTFIFHYCPSANHGVIITLAHASLFVISSSTSSNRRFPVAYSAYHVWQLGKNPVFFGFVHCHFMNHMFS